MNAASSADSVDYHKFEMDGEVRDILWCGATNEAILILTEKGSVYKSRDRGNSWKKLQYLLNKAGTSVADAGQQVRKHNKHVLLIMLNFIDWFSDVTPLEPCR